MYDQPRVLGWNNIPFHVYITFSSFTDFVDGHSGYFHILAIVSSAAVNTQVLVSLLEKAMAPHSSALAWRIPWTEEPGRRQSMGWLRVRHDFTFTFHFHALEKEMAPHSSVLAWRIPGTGEPVGLPSMGSHRVGHD